MDSFPLRFVNKCIYQQDHLDTLKTGTIGVCISVPLLIHFLTHNKYVEKEEEKNKRITKPYNRGMHNLASNI